MGWTPFLGRIVRETVFLDLRSLNFHADLLSVEGIFFGGGANPSPMDSLNLKLFDLLMGVLVLF